MCQEFCVVLGGDHLATRVAGTLAIVRRKGIAVDGKHLCERLLQFFEGMLTNTGVGLVEGKAGLVQQLA